MVRGRGPSLSCPLWPATLVERCRSWASAPSALHAALLTRSIPNSSYTTFFWMVGSAVGMILLSCIKQVVAMPLPPRCT